MRGWTELREIAKTETDTAIRMMAEQRQPLSYVDRLAGFLGDGTAREVSHNPIPLVMTDACDLKSGRPPKPHWLIRYFLERIHWLVSGHLR